MIRLTMILTGMLIAWNAGAAVYTWIDENGEVHYSDVPEVDGAVRVDIVSNPTNNQAVAAERQQAVNSELERQAQSQDSQQQAADNQASQKEDRELAKRNCETAKETYDTYYNAPRLYKPTEDGGREYLSGEEMDAARAKAQADVEEWCG